MAEKTLSTRIVHKHDIEENWLKAVNFIPKQGEIIIYDIDDNYTYERMKIGDGVKNVNDLPFSNDSVSVLSAKSGSEIVINDVSPVEHNIQVNIENKNLFYQNGVVSAGSTGLTASYDAETDTFTINGTQTVAGNITLSNNIEIPNGTYTVTLYPISGSISYVSGGSSLLSLFAQGSSNVFVDPRVTTNAYNYNLQHSSTGKPNNLNVWNGKATVYWQTYGIGNVYNNYKFKVQVEKGNKSTGYVSNVDLTSIKLNVTDGNTHQEYTPLSDGTVDGVKSIYPNMILSTDIEGLIINCEYLNQKYSVLENNHIKSIASFAANAEINKIVVDDTLSNTSINPVQNKVVNAAINNLSALVGDTAVSEQIAAANIIYVGPDMPTDPNIKVWINTAEEDPGSGSEPSVVAVLPRITNITLAASNWTGSSAPYSQVVEVATVTSATKVDLQPTASQLVSLQNEEIGLMAENDNGVITVYAFGAKPSTDMTMQAILQEVSYV